MYILGVVVQGCNSAELVDLHEENYCKLVVEQGKAWHSVDLSAWHLSV